MPTTTMGSLIGGPTKLAIGLMRPPFQRPFFFWGAAKPDDEIYTHVLIVTALPRVPTGDDLIVSPASDRIIFSPIAPFDG